MLQNAIDETRLGMESTVGLGWKPGIARDAVTAAAAEHGDSRRRST
jgi:hypothetical protein